MLCIYKNLLKIFHALLIHIFIKLISSINLYPYILQNNFKEYGLLYIRYI